MTLLLEIVSPDGVVQRQPIGDAANQITAKAGSEYRLIDTASSADFEVKIRQVDDDLIIDNITPGQSLTLSGFYSFELADSPPALSLDTLGGEPGETLTPDSEPIAALTEGGFLLWASPSLHTTAPQAPESEFSWRPIAAIGGGLALAAGAAGGGGEDAVSGGGTGGGEPAPTTVTPTITNQSKPTIAGTAEPGTEITLTITIGGTNDKVTYKTQTHADGSWSIDTANASPFTGTMPDSGLPSDVASTALVVTTDPNTGANSTPTESVIEIDVTPPAETATLDSVVSDAAAVANTDLAPGPIANNGQSNDNSPTLSGTISAPLLNGDVVTVLRDGQVVGQGQITGLNWTFTDANVPSGNHSYQATIMDPAGNRSASPSSSHTVFIDGTAPDAPTINDIAGDNIVDAGEAQNSVAVSGTAESGSTVTLTWGNISLTAVADAQGNYATSFDTNMLPSDGLQAVTAQATDSFGNQSVVTSLDVNLVTGLPGAPVIATDTGVLQGAVAGIDAAESAAGFVIQGRADAGNAIVVTFTPAGGGSAISANGTADSDGNFSIAFAADVLADGNYTVQANSTDIVGNSTSGPGVAVIVDRVAPLQSASINDALDDQDQLTGAIADGGLTNDSSPQLRGTVSAALANGESVQITRDGAVVGQATVTATNWTYQDTGLDSQSHRYTAVVIDAAGNTGPTTSAFDLQVDTTPPSAPSINVIAGDDIVTAQEATGGITVNGTGPAGENITVSWSNLSQSVAIDQSGNWSVQFDNVPGQGLGQVTATVADAAGNSVEAFRTVNVDTAPPLAPSIATVEGDDVVNSAEAAGGIIVSGSAEANASIRIELAGNSTTTTASTAGFWSATIAASDLPGSGQHSINVTATDAGGNTSPASSRDVRFDTQAPSAPQIDTVEGDNAVTAAEAADGITISGTAAANTIVDVSWAGASRQTTANGAGNWQVSYGSVPAQGATNVQVTATDSAGNTSVSASLAVQVNTTPPPGAPSISAVAGDNVVNGAEAAAGVSVSGSAQVGSTVAVTWGGTTLNTTSNGGGSWSVSFSAGQVPPNGSEPISAIASSASGSSAATTRSVQIDKTAPAAPGINTVEGDNHIDFSEAADGVTLSGTAAGASSVDVSWGGVTRTATVNGGSWSLNYATLPVGNGSSNITAQASDAAGNTGSTSTRAVTVDTNPPAPGQPTISTVAGDNVINIAESASGVTVTGTAQAGSTVNVVWAGNSHNTTANGAGNWSVNFGNAEVPATGSSTITATASNAGGSGPSANLAVQIDRTAPAAPSISTVEGDDVVNLSEASDGVVISGTAADATSVTVSWGGVTRTSTVSGGNWSVNYASLPVGAGASTISAQATDGVNNTGASASRSVTVDVTPPAPGAPTINTVAGDNLVNASEAAAGITITGTAQSGSTVNVVWGGNSHGATTNGAGNWSVTFGSAELPADGTASVSATASNSGGTSPTASRSVQIDATAPAAPAINVVEGDDVIDFSEAADGVIISGTAADATNVTVTWGGVQQSSVVSAGNWSVNYATVPVGSGASTVSVQASDGASNTGAAATRTVTVDNTPPAPPAPTIATVAADNLVNAAEAAGGVPVTGTAQANAAMAISWAGTTLNTTANGAGAWSVSFSSAQIPADGTVNVSATATNAGGSSPATTRAVQIDTTAPAAPAINLVEGDDIINLAEAADGVIVSGTAVDANSVTVSWGGVERTGTVSGGTWSVSYASVPVGSGTSSITAQASDGADNTGATASRSVSVDTTPPAPNAPTINAVSGDNAVTGAEAAAGIAVTGSAQANAAIAVSWGATTLNTTASGAGAWSVNFSSGQVPADGTVNVTATASNAGGTSSAGSQAVQIDTTAPTAPNINTVEGDNAISFAEAADGVTVSGTATDASSVTVTWGGVQQSSAVSGGSWSVNYASVPVGDGASTISAVASDGVGNTSAAGTQAVTVNTTPPAPDQTVTIANLIDDVGPDIGNVASGDATDDTAVEVEISLSAVLDSGESLLIYLDGNQVTTLTNAGTTSFTFDSAALVDGTYEYSAQVSGAGGLGTLSNLYEFTVLTPP